MYKSVRFSLLCVAALAGLSACATTSSDYLMNGIDPVSAKAAGSAASKTASSNVDTANVDKSGAATELAADASAIDADAASETAVARKASDETCEQFYKNAKVYLRASQQSVQNQVALAQMGVMILATVATGGVGGLGISSATGQMLAQQVATTGVQLGGAYAINGINKKSGPIAKVLKTAETLGCKVEFTQKTAQKAP